MIFTHCLVFYVALWLSGYSACLVNRRSLVQIRAASHFQITFACNYVYQVYLSK